MKVARFGIYRLAIAVSLWVFGVLTSQDFFSIALTFPLFVFIAAQMYSINRPEFTPEDMFWLCGLLFFVVSPCQRIEGLSFSSGPTFTIRYSAWDFVLAQLVVLLGFGTFSLFLRKAAVSGATGFARAGQEGIRLRHAFFIIALVVVCFFFYVEFSGGVANVLSPRRLKQKGEASFLRVAFLAIMVVGAMLLVIRARFGRGRPSIRVLDWCLVLVALVVVGVAVNPFNSSRFFVIASWLPLILIFAGRFARHEFVYGAAVVAIVFLMPLMSLTSRLGLEAVASYEGLRTSGNAFELRDMDVFDTLVHAVHISSDMPLGLGKYFLAIALFFVPRALWESKPVVGGLDVGRDLYGNYFAGTENLSFFIGGDFYLDLSFLGVIVGFAIAAWFWLRLKVSRRLLVCGVNLAPVIMIAVTPIMLRGPVGSVIGYPFCLVCAVLLYSFVLGMGSRRPAEVV